MNPQIAAVSGSGSTALLELKRHEAALESCDKAIALKPDDAVSHNKRGNALRALGQHDAALESYDRAILLKPGYADAYYNRGNVLNQIKQHDAAIKSFDRAIALNPDDAEAYNNRGIALQALKRLDAAIHSFAQAIALNPGYAYAFNNCGMVLHELKRYDEALACYDHALAITPDFAEAFGNRGNALQDLKRYDEALACYDKALSIKPDFAEALINRGNALNELKRHDAAVASYDRALSINPGFAEALYNRGNALQELERFDAALASYDRALAIKPDYAAAFGNRGNALKRLKRYDEALASYDNALSITPDFAETLSNRGFTLHELARYDEAVASYDKALSITPDFAEALSNRGNALKELKRYDEALASYARALSVNPDYAEAHRNESLCRLLLGDFERGWEEYEWRWKTDTLAIARRDFSQALWLGKEDISGKTILLHAEQGLGDTIQFARYAQAVAAKGAKVILEVHPALKALLSDIPGAYRILSRGEALPDFDFHCPLLSLPLAFNTRLETIPGLIPYLSASVPALRKWEQRLGQKKGPRVGLVWSGNPEHMNDRNRSIALSRLVALADPGVMLVSLQNEVRPKDEGVLAACKQILHFGPELKDFSDTAALVSNMDLVVSVDTSVAHLAGALRKPVWILLPFSADWRWLVDREDSPWYPSARLFRQPTVGDWDSVIDKVQRQLRAFLHETPG